MNTANPTAKRTTTAYYAAGGRLRALRLAFAAAERAMPALALRAAVRVFCTPLPPRPRPPRPMPGWTAESLPFEGASLVLHRLPVPTAARGTALLVHGWGGHAGQLQALATALATDGWAVVALELPAHGAAVGRSTNLPQFARGIEYACARMAAAGTAVDLLVAHSLGANAAAYAAARGLNVQRLVLLAPPASPRAYTRLFAHTFGLSERLRAALQARVEATEGVLMSNFEPAAVGPRIGVPSLVVHDLGDRINPVVDGEAFAAAIRQSEWLRTEGLGHRRLLDDPAVLRRVRDFAADRGETS